MEMVSVLIEIPEEVYNFCNKCTKDNTATWSERVIADGKIIKDGDAISREVVKRRIADLVVGGAKAIKKAGLGHLWVNGLHSAVREIDMTPSLTDKEET